jgi:hypothetical protein
MDYAFSIGKSHGESASLPRIKRVKSDSYLTYGQSCKTWNYTPPPPKKPHINSYVLRKCIMDGNIKEKNKTIYKL